MRFLLQLVHANLLATCQVEPTRAYALAVICLRGASYVHSCFAFFLPKKILRSGEITYWKQTGSIPLLAGEGGAQPQGSSARFATCPEVNIRLMVETISFSEKVGFAARAYEHLRNRDRKLTAGYGQCSPAPTSPSMLVNLWLPTKPVRIG